MVVGGLAAVTVLLNNIARVALLPLIGQITGNGFHDVTKRDHAVIVK